MKQDVKVWCFVLSKTWTGQTRTKVEDKQHNEIPTYEVECELVDTSAYLKNNSAKHISQSLMMKSCDLLGFPYAECNLHKKHVYGNQKKIKRVKQMPCGCKTKSNGTRTIVVTNPRTGKIISQITVPQVKLRKAALLPGLSRIMKDETMRRLVRPSRARI